MTPRFLHAPLLALCVALACQTANAAQGPLTNAVDVLSLPAAEARKGLPVSVIGVVTAAEPNWKGKFFVQDATGGVFVNYTKAAGPAPGDLVHVTGVTYPGGYAPDISRPHWEKLGTSPLPAAKPITGEQLMSGAEDGQRVEISAVVRSALIASNWYMLDLATGGYTFKAFSPLSVNVSPDLLVGAKVHVRGTAAATFNAPLRHILTVAMFVPQASDFIVDTRPSDDVFRGPTTPLNGIAQYRRNQAPDSRIRVKGVVIAQRPGEDIFLHDATGGLQVTSRETNLFTPGEVVEAIGFPDLDHYLPVLRDATIVRTKETQEKILPKEAPMQELADGFHHAEPLTLRGALLDSSVRRIGATKTRPKQMKRILTLQNAGFVFTAEFPIKDESVDPSTPPIGSMLEVSGVCLLQVGSDGKAETIQLLLGGPGNIRVLQKPSWWTPQRLDAVLGMALAVLAVAVAWTIMILKKNSALKLSIAEKINAQQQLQKANDLLESRVEERTRQLKFEMTARSEAEVQFKATLAERTRLAQELHDTLEQSLTGIGLQLDAAKRLSDHQPGRSSHHVDVARNLMVESQKELRRSIWDLRSRELQQFDLCDALRARGRQAVNGANIQIQVQTEGDVRPLSEVVEENLLRIGQEALTNVVKHAGASAVNMTLAFRPDAVVLKIQDDGKGFAVDHVPGASEGHFGLVGMQERSKRINGALTIKSSPNAGTCVAVEIPAGLPVEAEDCSPVAELA